MSYVSVHEYGTSYEVRVRIIVDGITEMDLMRVGRYRRKRISIAANLFRWFIDSLHSLETYRKVETKLIDSANRLGWKISDLPQEIPTQRILMKKLSNCLNIS